MNDRDSMNGPRMGDPGNRGGRRGRRRSRGGNGGGGNGSRDPRRMSLPMDDLEPYEDEIYAA